MNRKIEVARGMHFEVRVLKTGIRVFPGGEASITGLRRMPFEEGSSLYKSLLKVLRKMVDPDQIEWPPLPDPFGFLTGKQTIPWKLLNPATKKCIRCTPKGDGGVDCVEIPCDPDVS